MFEELKKKSMKSALWSNILLVLAGLALVVLNLTNAVYAVTGYAQFDQLEVDQIRSQLVDVDLSINFGCCLEEYEYNSDTHQRRTTNLYYVILTGDDYATDYRYMAIKVLPKYEKSLDTMADNTSEGYLSDPVSFSGKIKKLGKEEYSYFKEYFTSAGFSEDEFEESTLPYYIETYGSKASMNSIFILFLGTGIILLIIAIYRSVRAAGGGYQKKLRKDIADAGYSESTIEADFAAAESYDKKDTVKQGRLMTYYTNGTVTRAIPNNKIMWTYQNTVTHRTNGIKTGTTYNVVLFVEGLKKEIYLSVPDEAAAQKMLHVIDTTFPWVVVGYSDDLRKLFNKERAQFLELRYNKCEHVPVEPDIYGRTPINGAF